MSRSRFVQGYYPPPGSSPIADRIRERRGLRGITPLDGVLLHVPPVAEGWNTLFDAIRNKGKLPGDVRELMILRVAAQNHATFQWIHHERVGRSLGLTTPQLYLIRDTSVPAAASQNLGIFSSLQAAALAFADESTRHVKVSSEVMERLKVELGQLVVSTTEDETSTDSRDKIESFLVESAAVVASYNLVSRFLVSLDVGGMLNEPVPWPADRQEYKIPLSTHPDAFIHAITLITKPSAPWLVCSNSLLTNLSLWDPWLPYLLAPQSPSTSASAPRTYNLLLYDQRGHGLSSVPPTPCTIKELASDIAHILTQLKIPQVHSVIGVSQGGATALAFASMYPDKTRSVVACDTSAKTPEGNKEAWRERIELAKTHPNGMGELARVTLARWFPVGSKCHPGAEDVAYERNRGKVMEIITETSVPGFEAGAAALMDYDLIAPSQENHGGLLTCKVKTLLVAGSLDGSGKVAAGMRDLSGRWNAEHNEPTVEFVEIEGAGHLPMVDETERCWEVVSRFLEDIGNDQVD